MGGRVADSIRALPRFFASNLELSQRDEHKIRHVLRLKSSDELLLLGERPMRCRITMSGDRIDLTPIEEVLIPTEPRLRIEVCQALVKGDKMDQIVRQNTEAGAAAFRVMRTERCVARLNDPRADERLARWRRIAEEAAEQAFRAIVPSVNGVCDLDEAATGPFVLLLDEHQGARMLKATLEGMAPPAAVRILIGPEGGFTSAEVELAKRLGSVAVSLGPRVLRTETAALVAVSQLLFMWDGA